jgi:hypothetical protein
MYIVTTAEQLDRIVPYYRHTVIDVGHPSVAYIPGTIFPVVVSHANGELACMEPPEASRLE